MATLKYSRQREEIKLCLKNRMDHPTAEMIYFDLRTGDPKLSLGTVYRNLALLTQIGEIRKISVMGGPDRFDGDISAHYHFICRNCQNVRDLRLPVTDCLMKEAENHTDGKIEEIMLTAYGLCPECISTVTSYPETC